jgi:hypothetical protein
MILEGEFRSRTSVALRPKETSGSGVAFFLDTFSWLHKKKYLASRAKATYLKDTGFRIALRLYGMTEHKCFTSPYLNPKFHPTQGWNFGFK